MRLEVAEKEFGRTKTISNGTTRRLATLKAGVYHFYCSVPGRLVGAAGRVTGLKRRRVQAEARVMGRRVAVPLFLAALSADLVTKTLAVAYDRQVYFHPVAGELPKRVLMSALAVVAAVVLTHVASRRGFGRPWGAWIGVPLLVAGVLGTGLSVVIWPRGVPDFIVTGDWIGNLADFEIFFGIAGGVIALIVGFCLTYARAALAR